MVGGKVWKGHQALPLCPVCSLRKLGINLPNQNGAGTADTMITPTDCLPTQRGTQLLSFTAAPQILHVKGYCMTVLCHLTAAEQLLEMYSGVRILWRHVSRLSFSVYVKDGGLPSCVRWVVVLLTC